MNEPVSSMWLVKIAGAVGGSAISLAYLLPHGRREAVQRFFVGVVSGFIFGPLAATRLGEWGWVGGELEQALAGCAAVSAFAWFLIGVIHRRMNKVAKDD